MAKVKITLNDGTTKTVELDDGFTETDVQEVANQLNSNIDEPKKGIDLTPSGLVKTVTAGAVAPLRALTRGETIPEAYKRGREAQEQSALNKLSPVVDFGAYMALPQANLLKGGKLATVGNNLLTGGYQGGVIGGLESLKNEGDLSGAGSGSAIGAGITAGLPLGLQAVEKTTKLLPMAGGMFAKAFGRIQPETLERAVQADSKALDLNKEQAQNLLMNTTERIQKDYRGLMDKAGKAVNEAALRLPEDRSIFASSLQNSLDDIYKGHSVSGVDELNPALDVAGDIYADLSNKINIASDAENIGRISAPKLADIMGSIKNYKIDWNSSNAKERQAILKQIYGDFSRRLGNLSPELRKANREYSKLAKFDDNEGLKQIINPNVIDGNKIDSASSALRNYNSTVTKGNTNRNIQDLENLLVAKGKQAFLNDIDDVNAAMDLLNARSTGDSWLANLATQLTRPALKLARGVNRSGLPEVYERLKLKAPRYLTPLLYGTPTLYGEITND